MFQIKWKETFFANDIYDLLWPLLNISKIFALLPLRINKRSNKTLRDCGIPNVLLALGFVWSSSSGLYYLGFADNIGDIALRVQLSLGMTLIMVMMLMAKLRQHLFLQILLKIATLDDELKSYSITFDYTFGYKLVWMQIVGISCFFLCKLILQFNISNHTKFCAYSIFNLVDYINTLMLFQFVDILLILRRRYVRLNQLITNEETKLLRKWYLEAHRVKIIAKLHCKLHKICLDVNRMYGVQLLVTICIRFVMITMLLITIYKLIQQDYMEKIDTIYYILCAIYLLMHISKLFMIVAVAENITENAKRIVSNLHETWLTSVQLNEEVIYKQLLQILQFSTLEVKF